MLTLNVFMSFLSPQLEMLASVVTATPFTLPCPDLVPPPNIYLPPIYVLVVTLLTFSTVSLTIVIDPIFQPRNGKTRIQVSARHGSWSHERASKPGKHQTCSPHKILAQCSRALVTFVIYTKTYSFINRQKSCHPVAGWQVGLPWYSNTCYRFQRLDNTLWEVENFVYLQGSMRISQIEDVITICSTSSTRSLY